jgi:cell division transport system permease protein
MPLLRLSGNKTANIMSNSFFRTSGSAISSFSTVVGITLVLILVGVLLIVTLLGTSLRDHYRGQVVVQVLLKEDAPEQGILQFKKKIEGEMYAAGVTYLSKEQASEMMQKELGEEFVDFLGYNPLPASLDIRIHPDHGDQEELAGIVSKLEQQPLVHEVIYQQDMLRQMNANIAKWSIGLMIVGVLLLTIAVVLIVNTIQLAIFSQRFLIKSMQLVGATGWFIQKPFLRRGMWYGFVSSIFALAVIFGVIYYFRDDLKDIIAILQQRQNFLILIGGVLAIGLVMSWLATAYAVRKFIRTEAAKLY